LPAANKAITVRVLPGLTTIWLSDVVTVLCTGTGRTIVKRSVRVKRHCCTVTVASNTPHGVYDHMEVCSNIHAKCKLSVLVAQFLTG